MLDTFNTTTSLVIEGWLVVEYHDPSKLDAKKRVPNPIVRVFTNGTVSLQIAPNIQETFNIRKI